MPVPPEDDASVLAAISAELRLLDPAVRRDPRQVDALLDPEFVEVGQSGRLWNRDAIIATLAESPGDSPAAPSEIRGVRLSDDLVHLTYVTQRGDRRVHRSSLWRRRDDQWRAYYHQGTPAAD